MKTKTILTLSVGFLLALVCGNLSAQNTSTAGKTNLTAGPQAVTNHAVTNPDVLVVTGKIIDAVTKLPISNAKINFDKFPKIKQLFNDPYYFINSLGKDASYFK